MTCPRPNLSILLVLGLVFLAACSVRGAIDRSYEYARLGDYKHAFEVLEEAHSQMVANDDFDPRLDRAYTRHR